MALACIVDAFCLASQSLSRGQEKYAYEPEAHIINQRWEHSATQRNEYTLARKLAHARQNGVGEPGSPAAGLLRHPPTIVLCAPAEHLYQCGVCAAPTYLSKCSSTSAAWPLGCQLRCLERGTHQRYHGRLFACGRRALLAQIR